LGLIADGSTDADTIVKLPDPEFRKSTPLWP
jgi:hypothetical protein